MYCESSLEVYDVTTGRWIQNIPLRKVGVAARLTPSRPHPSLQMHALSVDGTLTMCCVSDPPTLLYLKKQMEEGE